MGPSTSTGLGCGRLGQPVLLRGLQEVIERDALMGAWWGRYPLWEWEAGRSRFDSVRIAFHPVHLACSPDGSTLVLVGKGGEVVYDDPVKEISWPENGARHVTENEANFRAIFIRTLSQKIAHDFYDYELTTDFAVDAANLAN